MKGSSEVPPGIAALKLAKPALRALLGAGYSKLSELARASNEDLLALHGMGPNALRLIRAATKVPAKAATGSRARARRDARVDEYIANSAPFARPLLRRMRSAIHAASPTLEETLRWGMPSYLHRGKLVCGIAAFKAHCVLNFHKGDEIVGATAKSAMGQFGRITQAGEIPAATDIRSFVQKAIARIDSKA